MVVSMMNEISESDPKPKRIRTVRNASLNCSESSDSNESDGEYSEDEWNATPKKFRDKKFAPKQTLKLKLAEKTKHLRKISKLNSSFNENKNKIEGENVTENIENDAQSKSADEETTISSNDEKEESKETKCSPEDSKPVINSLVPVSDITTTPVEPKIKSESKENDVKNDKSKIILDAEVKNEKTDQSRDPIVLVYGYSQPSTSNPISSHSAANHNLNDQAQPFSLQVSPVVNSNPATSPPNISPSDCHSFQNTINPGSNMPTVSNTSVLSPVASVSSSPFKNGIGQRTPVQRRNQIFSPRIQTSVQRTPSPICQRMPMGNRRGSPILQRTPTKIARTPQTNLSTRKIRHSFSPKPTVRARTPNISTDINIAHSVLRNTSLTVTKSPSNCVTDNTVLNKFKNSISNLSPNGTVVHTGTGSLTITPCTPERPPVQRKLFKNEIEGTISGRSVRGTLQYVVNLANGTYIPLSNLQVQKLREQNNGVLPLKLKIPVPTDVADKIEPSFLIED